MNNDAKALQMFIYNTFKDNFARLEGITVPGENGLDEVFISSVDVMNALCETLNQIGKEMDSEPND